jgi:glycosyltransferase involved in cell wall biosynthesis
MDSSGDRDENSSVPGRRSSKVLIVMPARNEAPRIGSLIQELRTRVPHAQVLVVDDESNDGTPEVARQAGALVAELPFHLGYGGALQTGYRFAAAGGFEFLVQLDSDGQHRAEDVDPLLSHVQDDSCDLVVGSRFAPRKAPAGEDAPAAYEMGALRSLGRQALCLFARLGGLRVTDPTSGFQAMNREAFELFASDWYPSDYPDVDVLLLADRRGLRIREHPVEMRASPRPSMLHSGWLPVYYAYRMMLSLWALSAVPRVKAVPSLEAAASSQKEKE